MDAVTNSAVTKLAGASATTWLPIADSIDPTIHCDFVGQNYRAPAGVQRSFGSLLVATGGVFARASSAYWMSSLGKLTAYGVDVPHISWSVPLASYRGLKAERSTVNLSGASNAFSGSVTNATNAASPVTGPDGTLSLRRIESTVAGGYSQRSNVTIAVSTTHTISAIVAKTASAQTARLQVITTGGTGGTPYTEFDLSTGTLGANTAGLALYSQVEDLGSFWRISLPFIGNTGDTIAQARFYPAGAAATGIADVGWLQIEAGFGATSSTTGRRERDAFTVPTSALGINSGAGTVSVTAAPPIGTVERVLLQIDDGTENNSIRVRRSTGANIEVVWTMAGSIVSTMSLGAHTSGSATVTVGWAAGSIKAIRDGVTLTTDTVSPPSGLTTVRVGGHTTATTLDGYVTAVTAWSGLRTQPFYTTPTSGFVALGDSMAAGSGTASPNRWSDLLAAALSRTWSNDSYPGQSSAYVLAQWQALPSHWALTPIIFVGHNFTTTTDPLGDIAAMIALQTSEPRRKRFLVVSPLQNTNNTQGGAGFNAILALRAALQAAYPNNYVDLYGYLATKGDGSGTDNAAIAAGYTPTSLLADTIHITAAAQVHEATLYQAELTKRGW